MHDTARYNKLLNFLLPFLEIFKCNPVSCPDWYIVGSIPAYATTLLPLLNLSTSPNSANILAAKLSPIPGILFIHSKFGIFFANSTSSDKTDSRCLIWEFNVLITTLNWLTKYDLWLHPEAQFST